MTEEQHKHILKQLKDKNRITVNELVELLATSESTIRRDLLELHRQDLLKRVHGGASAIHWMNFAIEDDVNKRQIEQQQEKEQITTYATKLIEPNDFIYIDAGTTTLKMLEDVTPIRFAHINAIATHTTFVEVTS